MFWIELLLALAMTLTVVFNGLAIWRARIFIRRQEERQPPPSNRPRPPVTILVPVRGIEGEGTAHFARFCKLDWPCYQVVFSVLDSDDPALRCLDQLRPPSACEVKIQMGGPALGANLKVRNLLNAWRQARHDWIVICDADVRPDPDFLEGLIDPMVVDPATGLVHSMYRVMDDPSLPSAWENVWINCDFWPQGLLGDWIRGTDFAFGAAMALHRNTLEQIGGLDVLRDYLADDYQLGHRVARLGKRLRFNPSFVTLQAQSQTWSGTWSHLLRWCRTIRICQPGGFAGSILVNMTLIALVAVLVNPPLFLAPSLLVIALRLDWANQCRNWATGRGEWWRHAWLILFKDLAQAILWLLAFHNGCVEWRGARYRLGSDGKLRPA